MLYPLSYRGAGRETRSASLAGTPQTSVCRGWRTVTRALTRPRSVRYRRDAVTLL